MVCLLALLVAWPLHAAADPSTRTMWMLNCQGCHRPDGGGTPGAVPAMPGVVARFLAVPGGREYLIRVPGVATAPLDDASLAGLMNWMLATFDAGNIPAGFVPYSAGEVGGLRRRGAYGREAAGIRAALLAKLK